jgi:hypothetical protein
MLILKSFIILYGVIVVENLRGFNNMFETEIDVRDDFTIAKDGNNLKITYTDVEGNTHIINLDFNHFYSCIRMLKEHS